MKNSEKWKSSKYEILHGRLRASRDTGELAVGSRFIADIVADFYSRAIPAYSKGRLVDLGCGKAPLYGLYKDFSSDVTLTDWPHSAHHNECLDCACDLNKRLPFPDNEFNTIILSDVLEHIAEPGQLWKEMHRILSAKGRVLLNTPFYYWIHEQPYDYYRYTEYALKYMAESAGFKVLELDCFGGAPEVVLDILSKRFARNKIGRVLLWAIQCLQEKTKHRALTKKSRKTFPLGYYMVVEKQEG